jgi:hypothetical protein
MGSGDWHRDPLRVPTPSAAGQRRRPAKGGTRAQAWLAGVAALQRDHNMNPAIIPQRMWRNLYIQGKTPQQAADRAAVSAYNRWSAADRLKRR